MRGTLTRATLVMALLGCIVSTVTAGRVSASPLPAESRLPITLDGVGYDLAARVYRPSGAGPFPLVVINHGTPPDKAKLPDIKLGYSKAASWFVAHGFMVVVALRPGFGSSSGTYLEAAGTCRNEDFVAAGRRTAAIEASIVTAAATLPGADPRRIVVVGQSAGGYGAVALADAPPPGVLGVISFAGGRGGNGKEHICAGEDKLIAAEQRFGSGNRLPQLWLYAANDHFFRPELAHRMAAAYAGASSVPISFVDLPAFGDDGHQTFARADPAAWAAPVAAFLSRIAGPAR